MHITIGLKPRPVWLPATRMFSQGVPAAASMVASCGGTTPSLIEYRQLIGTSGR